MSTYQTRPYQADCIAALAEARRNGAKKGLVIMASGLGKTVTAILDLQQFLQEHPGARILCLCHQESILLQSKAKFQKFFGEEYSYGMFTGNYKTAHPVIFLFATFQTMRDHREEFLPDAFDYIVVDEAHHTAAETYQPTADYFEPQFLLGLTATKDRMDGQDILDTYERVIYQMDIYDGWAEGWLARVDYRIMLDDLNQEEFEKYVGPHATDEKVSLAQLNKTIFAPQRDEGIIASIREQTANLNDPSIFIFCSSIGHANAMAHGFGGEAAVIHSGQSIGLNEAILSSFRSGDIRIIISVNMLNEGIDVPEADVVIFLRATESSTIFFQQLGRGLRISGEKRTVRVLDYVANIERIATILEMEETAKRRIPANPTYSPSANKPEPLVVNIPATKFKVQRVDVERLLEKARSGRSWTRKEVILGLRDMYIRGEKITAKAIDQNPSLPCFGVILQLFDGSLNNALIFADIPAERKGRVRISRQEVIEEVARMIQRGQAVTDSEIDANPNLPASGTVRRMFESKEELLELAGMQTEKKDFSAEGMLKQYWQESKKVGHWLTDKEIKSNSKLASNGTYRKIFRNIKHLRERAQKAYGLPFLPDIEATEAIRQRNQLAREYYEASVKRGRWIKRKEINHIEELQGEKQYFRYFKDMADLINYAVQQCGTNAGLLAARRQRKKRTSINTMDILVKEYFLQSKRAGHWLTTQEIDKNEALPNHRTCARICGSVLRLRQLAAEAYGDLTKENN